MNKYLSIIQDRFNIGYYKTSLIDIHTLEHDYISNVGGDEFIYNPFKIDKLQNYNPIYNQLFTLSSKNYNNIQLNQPYHFINAQTVINKLNERIPQNVFIKYSPLLDPLRYMVGKYEKHNDIILNLPYPTGVSLENSYEVLPKINSIHNCSYVDAFFCYLSSMTLHTHNVVNCLDFYDSFLGIQSDYKYNISDDIDYLTSSDFFNANVGKLYTLENVNMTKYFSNDSRKRRSKLCISKSNHNISVISISPIINDINDITIENIEDCMVYDNTLDIQNIERPKDTVSSHDSISDDNSSVAYTTDSNNSDDNDDNDWETDEDDRSESDSDSSDIQEENQCAYIKNFPVQMICLEKCDGTLDELFTKKDINVDTAASALFQVVMTLIIYQKVYGFTHNDLHTNNIMYINTDVPFLYYKYENLIYKVPTYGKIYKIIDFGRSIYRFNGVTYCSDSFAPGGDADTQYNCEPFLNDKKPRLEPNMSFDLCRLGCSIYDFIIPEHLDSFDYDELQKTIHRWCMDDANKNVLYKTNGDERYPDFKLYKMIARTVHQHTPQKQLEYPFFKQFLYTNEEIDNLIDINSFPIYI